MSVFPVLNPRKIRFGPEIVVRASPLDPRRGILVAGPLRLPCALGRSGIGWRKREGDGRTPLASMAVVSGFWRPGRARPARCPLPLKPIRGRDGWCDAPGHAAYNRPVRLPFPASAEAMRRADRLYDVVVVLDWNVRRRMRGAGSAIFLHVAKAGYAPTEGCIAVSRRDMERLAPLLRPGVRIDVRR